MNFFSSSSSSASGTLQQRKILWAGLGIAVIVLIVASVRFGRPVQAPAPTVERTAFDADVISVQENDIPHGFPSDMPLEKNEPGYKVLQSTGTLDYMQKFASYLVGFVSPWSIGDIEKKYTQYLKSHGYADMQRTAAGENGITLMGAHGGERLTIVAQEEKTGSAPVDTKPMVRVAISYTKL